MMTMKAVRIHEFGDPEVLRYEDAPKPQPASDEILVRVHATSVNPVDWKIRSGAAQSWLPVQLPFVPGCDFAGVVETVGAEFTRLKAGDKVYGYIGLPRCGANAEYIIAKENEVTRMPETLDFVQAAAVPVGALTAWQAIFDAAGLKDGQKILVHAAAGSVGSSAVQLAKAKGAYVIGTASARNTDFVKSLGADEVIDYTTTKFAEAVKDVDVVFDLIGGDTLAQSYAVVKAGGYVVSAVQPPDPQQLAAHNLQGSMVGVQPRAEQLDEITALIDAGKVKALVETVLPLSDIRQAHELSQTGRTRGKIILTIEQSLPDHIFVPQ